MCELDSGAPAASHGNDSIRRQVNALHVMGLLTRHRNPDEAGTQLRTQVSVAALVP